MANPPASSESPPLLPSALRAQVMLNQLGHFPFSPACREGN